MPPLRRKNTPRFSSASSTKRPARLTYTNAGHLPPLLLRGNNVELLDPTGTIVGAFAHAKYEERTLHMEPGDVLMAYTDGIRAGKRIRRDVR